MIMDGTMWGMALGLSLGGSLHCMGMCGGFALMANAGAGRVGLRPPFVAYATGKTAAYALMGLLAGSVGSALTMFRSGGMILAWVAGLAMVAVGGHLLGWRGFGWISGPVVSGSFVSRMAALIKRDNLTARFGMGVLNGWLPCGLVYAALAMAAGHGNAAGSAAFMAVFGMGTIPSLWLAAQITGAVSALWKARLARLSGWMVVLFGLYTILRGSGLMSLMISHSM